MSLLTTKLYVPPVRPQLVERPRLVERLEQALRLGHRLTLISAPAGFGKTTLVSEWQHGRCGTTPAVAFTWLSLDENDNDPARFLTYFLAALQRVDPAIGQAALAMMQAGQPPPAEPLLSSLLNDLAALPQPIALVLDDYHLIQSPPIHQQLGFLLEHRPPQMHLVIVTREDPPLALPRLRARGQMTDIRQRDLQFTEEETAGFLRKTMELELSSADVATLHRRTEGWIAGLQLAALSMRQSDDIPRFVGDLDGSQRYILEYLIEEVFARQAPAVQEFLIKTSILDRLTAALCDAVTGRDDGRQMLLALDQANLFLVRLDESRQWYRYHRLFRDLLRSQGEGLNRAALHLRAARWYEQNGLPEEAMGHALAAQDWDEAGRLMEGAATMAINNGQFATLSRWLGALPEERLRASSELAALKAWALLWQGQFDAARIWIELAGHLLPPGAPHSSQASVICLRIYLAQIEPDMGRVIELAHQALALLEEGDPLGLRGAALSNLASAQAGMGNIPAAAQTFREMARFGREKGLPISAVGALGNLAWLEHLQGRPQEALALCHQALELGVDVRGNRLPLAQYTHLALGLIHYDLDELALAREHLGRGLELRGQAGPTTAVIQAAFTLAWIQHSTGETEAALATVAGALRAAAQLHLTQADALAAAWEADWQLRIGNVEAAVRWADRSGLSPADSPTLLREVECFTYARVLLAQHWLAEALTLLAHLESFARGSGLVRSLITARTLQAAALQALGQQEQAMASLEEAVRLAAPGGYRRAFLDEGPAVAALLPGVRHAAPEFVEGLLGGMPPPTSPLPGGKGSRARRQPLVEPLSERELEVLRLMAEGLSNQEIGGRLFITVGTVKTHVHNICGKLGAGSRTQAAALARDLELL